MHPRSPEISARKVVHIGLDDTDSQRRGCTTYVASILIEELLKRGVRFVDFPSLVRLNPNVPWKTRGNGAVSLRVVTDDFEGLKEVTTKVVEEHSDLESYGTDPGVVFYRGVVTGALEAFAERTIKTLVKLDEALKLIDKCGGEFVRFKDGRGVIGGLAAIGEQLLGDHTFEIIAYRLPKRCGTTRMVDVGSILSMNRETTPLTFNNVDLEKDRVLITPHSPDPILYGIRGETPEVVKKAFDMVKPLEEVDRWTVFRTNHGTDAHLEDIDALGEARPYMSVAITGRVAGDPVVIEGGHVILRLERSGEEIECAAYEPTGFLNGAARRLIDGDAIRAYGSIKASPSTTGRCLNLEKIELLRLAPSSVLRNPRCTKCGKSMSSLGRDKGFRCKKCGCHMPKAEKVPVEVSRSLKETLYISSPRAHRHLMRPYSRYGRERSRLRKGHLRCCDPSEFYWSSSFDQGLRG